MCLIIDRSSVLGWGMCHRQLRSAVASPSVSVTREEVEKDLGRLRWREAGDGLPNLTISHPPMHFTPVQFTTLELLALLWQPKGRNAQDGGK